MNISVSSSIENDYVLIEATATILNVTEYKLLMSKFFEEIVKYDMTKVLVDMRKVQFPVSLEQASESVSFIFETLPEVIKKWKIAGVVTPSIKPIADFWEFKAKQNGLNYNVFSSIEKARFHILGKHQSSSSPFN